MESLAVLCVIVAFFFLPIIDSTVWLLRVNCLFPCKFAVCQVLVDIIRLIDWRGVCHCFKMKRPHAIESSEK